MANMLKLFATGKVCVKISWLCAPLSTIMISGKVVQQTRTAKRRCLLRVV